MRRYRIVFSVAAAIAAIAATGWAGSAAAQSEPAQGVQLHAGGRVVYDTNFFRIDNSLAGTPAIDARGLADTTLTGYVGIDALWRVGGGQEIVITGELNENVQDVYSEADYTGGNLLATFNWQLGAATYGNVAFDNIVDRVDFENQDVPIIKFRTRNRLSGEINRRLTTNWAVGAGAGFIRTDFDAGIVNEVERQDAFVRVAYTSRRGNEFRLLGTFEDRMASGLNNLGFTGFAVGPELDWKLSPSFLVTGEIKYQERNPEDPALVAFDGPTGHIGLRFEPSNKVALHARAVREISTLGDQLSNYAVIDRQSITMEWNVSTQLGYYVRAEHERRDFELEPSLLPVPDLVPREDELVSARIGLRWDPRRRLNFEAYAQVGDRSSNRQFRDFRYEMYLLEFQYNFL
ncbi:MAG TPA: outer membrane beta-barrel protein [Woeseiaceae bacterium]|nr:outer membrane beta-barrel protein [Woeseiaceae bacterium]